MPSGTRKGSPNIDTPLKPQISRRFQELGGEKALGAASQTAREFQIKGEKGASKAKKIDSQVRDGKASRKDRPDSTRNCGLKRRFSETISREIEEIFAEDDLQTYREAGAKLELPEATLRRYATKYSDFRCLTRKVCPMPPEANRDNVSRWGRKSSRSRALSKTSFIRMRNISSATPSGGSGRSESRTKKVRKRWSTQTIEGNKNNRCFRGVVALGSGVSQ